MHRNRLAVLLCTLLLAAPAGRIAFAQGSVLAELYGQGVHQYFGGRYFEAHESLSDAIAQGSMDPRSYFFRGLTALRLGRTEEAKQDFDKGAELEAMSQERVYPIGRSLQRIQGSDRLLLENHRQAARIAARKRQIEIQRARYEEMKRQEGQVLRDPNRKPPASTEELVGPPPAEDPTDPFDKEEVQPEVAPPKESPVDSVAAPEKADEAAGEGDTAKPADEPPAPAEVDPFADDPFGAPTDTPASPPADDDPFGDPFN